MDQFSIEELEVLSVAALLYKMHSDTAPEDRRSADTAYNKLLDIRCQREEG